jgi:hypothetical protein
VGARGRWRRSRRSRRASLVSLRLDLLLSAAMVVDQGRTGPGEISARSVRYCGDEVSWCRSFGLETVDDDRL